MNKLVILSEAKDHLEGIERRKKILRFAQDDKLFQPSVLAFSFATGRSGY